MVSSQSFALAALVKPGHSIEATKPAHCPGPPALINCALLRIVCRLPNAAIVRKVLHPFMIKRYVLAAMAACCAMTQGFPADFRITSFDRLGHVGWTNAPISGIVTVETAADPAAPCQPPGHFFSTNASGPTSLHPPTHP